MSYIRPQSVYRYVDAENPGDYIFESVGFRGMPDFIEDYGHISDATLMEFVCRISTGEKDELFKRYVISKLAERLNVKLFQVPLDDDEKFKRWCDKLDAGLKE